LQPQSLMLFRSELKREIGWESFTVARHLLVKPLNTYAIKFSEVHIENYSLAPKNQDARFHSEDWRPTAFRHAEESCFL